MVLLSGGLDSSTVLAFAIREGFEVYTLTFDYGQRHKLEIHKAKAIASVFGVKKHFVQKLELGDLAKSALTSAIDVPKNQDVEAIGSKIPVTYVPARNTIFLSFGLALAEGVGGEAIFFGANAIDYSGYPDCRPEFIRAFEVMANLGTKMSVEGGIPIRIVTPLLYLSKAEIILKALDFGVPLELTHSCYDPSPEGESCGRCDSCQLRRKGFQDAGLRDPIAYPV